MTRQPGCQRQNLGGRANPRRNFIPVGRVLLRAKCRSLFKLDFDKLAFGELDGSEIMDGEAIGVASTLVVDETRYRLEIMDVLIFFVDLRLGSSSDSDSGRRLQCCSRRRGLALHNESV